MRIIKQYIIDAFAENIFEGNPAAVCILKTWPDDRLLLNIAKENNLSETAFVSESDNYSKLRWFTPGEEIDLCGHATLATAFVLFNYYNAKDQISFNTKSGIITVEQKKELYKMVFPSFQMEKIDITRELIDAIGIVPKEAYLGRDMVLVLNNEESVRTFNPDLNKIKNISGLLLHVTEKGENFDCVSRTFAPKVGVPEDPVCGSGHCHLIPLWAKKLNKENIIAFQASEREGTLYCKNSNDIVEISGKAQLFSYSTLNIKGGY